MSFDYLDVTSCDTNNMIHLLHTKTSRIGDIHIHSKFSHLDFLNVIGYVT